MQNISEYEIAQKRIAERQAKKPSIFIGIIATVGLIVSGILLPCALPFGIIALLITLQRIVEYYFLSPRRIPSRREIEQELEWLFGEDWQESSNTLEYAFAQDRIRKRRIRRWTFTVNHLLVFMPFIVFITYGGIQLRSTPFMLSPIWSIIYLIWRGRSVFPTPGRLAKIERKAGMELQRELQSIRPEKVKHEEKLKRQPLYEIGDDGELVEVEDIIEFEEDKPKNDLQSSS